MKNLAGKLKVDFRSTEPIYLQIARQIEQMVAKGELKLGDQLPTVRELATELRINFNTVSRAYKVLDDTRVISTQRGRGTYIWEEPAQMDQERQRQASFEKLTAQYIRDALRLGFSLDEIAEAVLQHSRDLKLNSTPPPAPAEDQ